MLLDLPVRGRLQRKLVQGRPRTDAAVVVRPDSDVVQIRRHRLQRTNATATHELAGLLEWRGDLGRGVAQRLTRRDEEGKTKHPRVRVVVAAEN
jgi:hypothetical protein